MWEFRRRFLKHPFSTMARLSCKCFMKQDKKIRAEAKARESRRPPHYVSIHARLRAADARRSVKNILWNCYLPADCVKTLVRMGWDFTT